MVPVLHRQQLAHAHDPIGGLADVAAAAFRRALESAALRNIILGRPMAGAMILAGHCQSALYGFFALALFAGARLIAKRAR
jgi:hypothetical protein